MGRKPNADRLAKYLQMNYGLDYDTTKAALEVYLADNSEEDALLAVAVTLNSLAKGYTFEQAIRRAERAVKYRNAR